MRHERVKEREIEKELERESKKGRSRKMEGGRWKTQTGKKKNWEERTREFERETEKRRVGVNNDMEKEDKDSSILEKKKVWWKGR